MPVSGNYGTPDNPNGDIYSSYWELQWYTGSDPAHVEGDFWGRSDLDSGDKIATLRFDNGNTAVDIPVFPAATDPSSSDIKKVARVPTPNGRGWMPIFENGGAYPYLGYQHSGTRHGVHDRLSAVPKAVTNHWRHSEGSGTTLVDNIGSINGNIFGASWVTGSGGLDDAYLSYNTSSDYTDFSNDSSHFDNDTFSFWVWLYFDSPMLDDQAIWELHEGGFLRGGFQFVNGYFRFIIVNGIDGSTNSSVSGVSVQADTWIFLCGVAENGNQIELYKGIQSDTDVSLVGTDNYNSGLSATPASVYFGQAVGGGDYFGGDMDDAAYAAEAALSQSDVEYWFDRTKGNYA